MNEKNINRTVLERIAKDIMKLETEEQINAFVSMFVYTVLVA